MMMMTTTTNTTHTTINKIMMPSYLAKTNTTTSFSPILLHQIIIKQYSSPYPFQAIQTKPLTCTTTTNTTQQDTYTSINLQTSSRSLVKVTSHSITPAPCNAAALYDSSVCSGNCIHAPRCPMEKSVRAYDVLVLAHSSRVATTS